MATKDSEVVQEYKIFIVIRIIKIINIYIMWLTILITCYGGNQVLS